MRTTPLVTIATLAFASSACVADVTISNLGLLPGGTYSYATALSSDGSAVAGYADTTAGGGGDRAFRWTVPGGIQSLGTLPGGASSGASGISASGGFVTGGSDYFDGSHGFRWNVATGIMEDIGELPGGSFHASSGYAMSGDGNTIVGNSFSGIGYRAFRWRTIGGIESLGQLPGGFNSSALGVSADGSVAAGVSDSPIGNRAFRWTSGGGMQNLGIVSGSGASYGWAINADGSVIVGKSDSLGATVAMRWTAATGMQSLGLLPGSPYSSAHGVSGDGSVIVGVSAQPGFSSYHAFLWKSSLGMVDLNTYLPTLGLNLTGWTLSQALAVSSDGTAITGHGILNGQTRAWVVRGLPGACVGAGISLQPASATACPANGSTFSVAGTGTGPLIYQWKIESPANSGTFSVLSGPTFSEPASGLTMNLLTAATGTIAVSNIQLGNHPNIIRLVGLITNACGSVTSNPATLTIIGPCVPQACSLADVAGAGPTGLAPDGIVDGSDFIAFINSFSTGDPAVDALADVAGGGADGLSPDGIIDGSDFIAFINAFAAGC